VKRYTIAQEPAEDRVQVHERQIAFARQLTAERGGKFRHARGTDAFGHPIILVSDPTGKDVAEIRQTA